MPLSNPNRSGDPKTKAGKRRSSFNALVTGAYSKYALLPHESQRDFERMYQQMITEWKPTDFTGEMLIRNLADLFWRKLRLQHVEPLVILDKKGPTT
jgi:hypothetical protein